MPTMAEVEELRANADVEASGTVIESKLDPGRGPVVTVLIGRGTLDLPRRRDHAPDPGRGQRSREPEPSRPGLIRGPDRPGQTSAAAPGSPQHRRQAA